MSRFAKSTLIVAVFFGLEKVLGFARQILMRGNLGSHPNWMLSTLRTISPTYSLRSFPVERWPSHSSLYSSETLQKQDRQAAWN